jgi:hypothetical protein
MGFKIIAYFWIMTSNMMDKYKHLSFIIAIKRYKKNSVIKKIPKYIACKQYGLSVNTYSKYLNQCIQAGYIIEEKEYYRVIKFKEILIDLFENQNLYFNQHKILKTFGTNFNIILQNVEEIMVADNIIKRQGFKINKKYQSNLVQRYISGTDRKAKSELFSKFSHKAITRMVKKQLKSVSEKITELNKDVVTSSRHTSKTIGVSIFKANKILNRQNIFERQIKVKWVHGITDWKYEELRCKYPNSVVIPCFKINMFKVCHGSSIKLIESMNPFNQFAF